MPTLLQVENLTRHFGEKILFENISFSINQYQKVALIAGNGAGKTSLLSIINGSEPSDGGTVTLFNQASMAYLRQEPVLNESLTVFDEVYATSNDTLKTIHDYEEALELPDRNLLSKAMERMDAINGWDYENRIKQILTRLSLTNLHQAVSALSGGQKKRLALAKTLITEPDFLILDEPTNHLDIDMIEWLEEYLTRNQVTLLMVTHDRYFLNRVCDEILEMENGRLFRHKGNYEYFLEKSQERKENETQETEKARNILRTEAEWMRRMPKARTTKSKARIDSFYELKEKAANKTWERNMTLGMEGERMGKKILEIHDVSFSWGDLPILEHFGYIFKRREKIGIIGKNGSGKSTFLDIVTSRIHPQKGTVETGGTIKFGHYRQDGIVFDEQTRMIDVVKEIADVVQLSNGDKVSAAHFLNYFMFPYPMHYQFVYKLSGGEKRRLYLVTVLMRNPNFLILDEPTNDLDILTLNILEDYLASFQGCVLVVTHDRFFLDKIVDHLFVFEGNAVLKDFPGNYSQYREWADQKKRQAALARVGAAKEPAPSSAMTRPKKPGLSYKENVEFETLEKEIHDLEVEKQFLETALGSGILDQQELMEKSQRFSSVISGIDSKTERWMELSEKNLE
ncbi:MAG: ABC-F family ATP-binding cassette domain-containing protein [Bacteroidetes bacterium]|nr:ABC-F family ATP-binding cassette domain-containing protein [Bacteroidota bacterium]